MAAAKKKAFKIPKQIGACADLLYTLRAERLEIQKKVAEYEEQEKELKNYIINNLPKSNATGISGKAANVRVITEDIPVVEDWGKFYAYVKKNNAFDMLQRRLNTKAVEERLEAKKKVSGVGVFTATKVSCTKV